MSSSLQKFYDQQIKGLSEAEKLRLVDLITRELASGNGGPPARHGLNAAASQAARDRFRQHAGAVSLGFATGADNDRIDDDLNREYGARSGSD